MTETFAAAPRRAADDLGPHRRRREFSLRLRAGPSREVIAGFAGTRTADPREPHAAVHLGVAGRRSASRASAATRRRLAARPVVFSGRVARQAGTAPLAEGLPVELQFRYPGADWSEFRTVETDARGRFRYAYRFSDDDSRGVRFQFRAYVKGREGWPYEPSASRPVTRRRSVTSAADLAQGGRAGC